ncbi:metal-sensitive transcriptional regulator [Microcoleus sp. FACHB-1515]|nr:metal-sensitive transcriptional regulator [Microcoleus sp. FACHB-1515]
MIKAERPCPDVIVQIMVVRSSLNKVASLIVADHTEHCLVEAAESGDVEAELANLRAVLDLLL